MNEDFHLWLRAMRVFASGLARELGPNLVEGLKGASGASAEHSLDDEGEVYLSVRDTCERRHRKQRRRESST